MSGPVPLHKGEGLYISALVAVDSEGRPRCMGGQTGGRRGSRPEGWGGSLLRHDGKRWGTWL